MEAARTVKDVSPHEFVKSYAAHLKRSGRVFSLSLSLSLHKLFSYMYISIFLVLWTYKFALLNKTCYFNET